MWVKYLEALILAAIACANVRCSLTTELDGLSGGAGEDAKAGASEILAIGGDDGMSVVTDVGAARILPNGALRDVEKVVGIRRS